MNRIDRLSAILIQLQSKKFVKAQDIAERFAISLRTVYRDVRALEAAGIPINGEAGIGYSLMDGYRLPPVMFTREEAVAFLTAEKLVEKLTDPATEQHYKSAMYKIKAVLKTQEKEHLEHMNDHIEVLRNPYLPKDHFSDSHIQTILQCISAKSVLAMQYFANHNQQQTKRDVEPVGIFYAGSHWYLIGYCLLRKDYRTFRIDRILSAQSTTTHYSLQHPSLKTYLTQLSKEKDLQKVVMLVDKATVKHLGEQKYYNGFVSEKHMGERVEMTFLTDSLHGFARWYMMFGDKADIISPDSLKDRIHYLASDILKK